MLYVCIRNIITPGTGLGHLHPRSFRPIDSDGSEHGEVHTYLIISAIIVQPARRAWNGRVLRIYETFPAPVWVLSGITQT